MADAVYTVTRPTGVRDTVQGNKKIKYRDITVDTGDYVVGGTTVTAGEFGLNRIDFVQVGSVATNGTASATAQAIGVTYAAEGQSVTFWTYESGASGAPLAQKTAEAFPANTTFRVKVEGSG